MNRPKYPPTKHITETGFANAYHKLVSTCLKEGAIKKRFYGKPVNTYDIISLTEINKPLLEPMLHPNFPTKELHLKEYEKQWDRDYDWRKQGFEYNYMSRLIRYPVVPLEEEHYHKSGYAFMIDQLRTINDNIHKRIEKGGDCLVSNRDQVITWIPDRDMFVSEDQPCMQRIQFFIYDYPQYLEKSHDGIHPSFFLKNGKVEFHVSWRSRDGYAAWNSNMIGLTKMLNKEIFEPNNLELIRVIDFCNSFHIYEGDWEEATKVKPVQMNPQMMRY